MLRSVLWSQYIHTVLILLAIYYPVIILLYYRGDVLKYFMDGIALSKAGNNSIDISQQNIQPAVHELMADLNVVFKNAAYKKIIKEELVIMVQNKIKDYPELKQSDLLNEITNHIAFECNHQCNIDLSEEELRMLWQ